MKIRLSNEGDLELSRKGISKLINQLKVKDFSELNYAILNILKDIDREISRLISSINEIDYASLHTRNIFDLYLILRNVYSNENEMRRWYGQQHKDSTDVRNGFKVLLEKKNLDTTELTEIQAYEDRALAGSHYESERNFNISHLAKIHGYGDDYSFVYKLSSKLIHPSAMKVNSYEILTENCNYLGIIIQIAVHFSQKVEKYSAEISKEVV